MKPIVKITGEFWAQTTEGDGNYRMFSFLEREGAQVLVEPIGTWIMYMIHQAKQANADKAGVTEDEAMPASRASTSAWPPSRRPEEERHPVAGRGRLHPRVEPPARGARQHPPRAHRPVRAPADRPPDGQLRAGGGEGHLEVAKNIYYSNKDMCHMVLSLKPFGHALHPVRRRPVGR